jgi:MFS family permease
MIPWVRLTDLIKRIPLDESHAESTWRWVFGIAWFATAVWCFITTFLPELTQFQSEPRDFVLTSLISALVGLSLTLFWLAIPLRVLLNTWFPARRMSRFKETICCFVAFAALCWAWYSANIRPSRSWDNRLSLSGAVQRLCDKHKVPRQFADMRLGQSLSNVAPLGNRTNLRIFSTK